MECNEQKTCATGGYRKWLPRFDDHKKWKGFCRICFNTRDRIFVLGWLKNVIYVFMSTKLLLLFSKGTVQVLRSELRGGYRGKSLDIILMKIGLTW